MFLPDKNANGDFEINLDYIVDVFTRAAQSIADRGITKQTLFNIDDGSACGLGHIGLAVGVPIEAMEARSDYDRHSFERVMSPDLGGDVFLICQELKRWVQAILPNHNMPVFNDDETTTAEDVRQRLLAAARNIKEYQAHDGDGSEWSLDTDFTLVNETTGERFPAHEVTEAEEQELIAATL